MFFYILPTLPPGPGPRDDAFPLEPTCAVPDSWVGGPGDDDPLIILKTQHWSCVTGQDLQTLQRLLIPDLSGERTRVGREGRTTSDAEGDRGGERKRGNISGCKKSLQIWVTLGTAHSHSSAHAPFPHCRVRTLRANPRQPPPGQ